MAVRGDTGSSTASFGAYAGRRALDANFMRALERTAPLACIVDALTFDVAWTSARAAALFGAPQQGEPLGFLAINERKLLQASLEAVRLLGARQVTDHWSTTAAGTRIYVRYEASGIDEGDGARPAWLLITMTDISDLAGAREAQVVVDDVDSIVWEVDLSTMRFTFVSRQAERLLGYPVERWLSDANFWIDHMHPEDRCWAPAFCEGETQRLKAHEFEYRMLAADGRTVWVRDIVTVVVDRGAPRRLRGVLVDITSSKEAEAERDRLRAEEQASRATLINMQQRLDALLRQREDFLSDASHELRTPLTPLRLQIQSLMRDADRGEWPVPEPQRKKLEIAQRQVDRLGTLVSGLLDVFRAPIAGGLYASDPWDLAELAREVMEQLVDDFARAGTSAKLTAPSPVEGAWDRDSLRTVLGHLVRNAIKYGLGSPIEITVARGKTDATLEVRDGGIGIPPEDQARIFERYERGEGAKAFGGLGLGLHTARRIVEAHGGKIDVKSARGEGATFVVTLPAGR
jgi:PAS domain S-box-containing protein